MKKFVLLGLSLALIGCSSTSSPYGPVNADSRLGYQQTKLQQDRFRVRFTGKDVYEVQDYALLRAAELTLDEGYSHFKVLDGHMSDDRGRSFPISSGVGVSFGGHRYGGTRGHLGMGVNDVVRAFEGQRMTSMLEIQLLHSGTNDPDVYDAASVAGSIKPTVFKKP